MLGGMLTVLVINLLVLPAIYGLVLQVQESMQARGRACELAVSND